MSPCRTDATHIAVRGVKITCSICGFSPFAHAHNLLNQFNPALTQPDLLYPLFPPSLPLLRPLLPQMMLTTKYARVRLTKIKRSSLTYVTLVGICTASSHPSPPSQLGLGNVPMYPSSTPTPSSNKTPWPPLPLGPFSIPTPIKHRLAPKKGRKKIWGGEED